LFHPPTEKEFIISMLKLRLGWVADVIIDTVLINPASDSGCYSDLENNYNSQPSGATMENLGL
jgi:hypothetical protein